MLIINTTFFISDSHTDIFLKWINEKHIPKMLGTEHFSEHRLCKILSAQEPGSCSYSLQFQFATPEAKQEWEEKYIHEMQNEIGLLFNENVLSFSTLMERI